MNVKYEIMVAVTASGLKGPLHVVTMVEHALRLNPVLKEDSIEIGHVRIAAIYGLAPDDKNPVVGRMPGRDQGREVEAIKDPRIT